MYSALYSGNSYGKYDSFKNNQYSLMNSFGWFNPKTSYSKPFTTYAKSMETVYVPKEK